MAGRLLTLQFKTEKINNYCRKRKIKLNNLISGDPYNLDAIVDLIILGNMSLPVGTEEQAEESYSKAYEILDAYLKEPENTLITAYFDLVIELNQDLGILPFDAIKFKKICMETFNKKGEDHLKFIMDTANEEHPINFDINDINLENKTNSEDTEDNVDTSKVVDISSKL